MRGHGKLKYVHAIWLIELESPPLPLYDAFGIKYRVKSIDLMMIGIIHCSLARARAII